MVEPVRHRQTKEAATDMSEPKATASHLDSTFLRPWCRHSHAPPITWLDRFGIHWFDGFDVISYAVSPERSHEMTASYSYRLSMNFGGAGMRPI
jgi:hypothetical protein